MDAAALGTAGGDEVTEDAVVVGDAPSSAVGSSRVLLVRNNPYQSVVPEAAGLDVHPGSGGGTYSRRSNRPREERAIGREAVRSFDPAALIRLRRAGHLSHDALGALVDIARPTLIAYEKGTRTPGPATLRRLADAFGVDALELMSATLRTATLADLRARTGLSKTDISARLQLERHTYDRIERGARQLEPELAAALASLLEVTPSAVRAAHRRAQANRAAAQQQ